MVLCKSLVKVLESSCDFWIQHHAHSLSKTLKNSIDNSGCEFFSLVHCEINLLLLSSGDKLNTYTSLSLNLLKYPYYKTYSHFNRKPWGCFDSSEFQHCMVMAVYHAFRLAIDMRCKIMYLPAGSHHFSLHFLKSAVSGVAVWDSSFNFIIFLSDDNTAGWAEPTV